VTVELADPRAGLAGEVVTTSNQHRVMGEQLAPTSTRYAHLLVLDPDLGRLLPEERGATARRAPRTRAVSLEVGEWDEQQLTGVDPAHLGLLMVEGVLTREVVLEDTVSTELLGPGDIVRPWTSQGPIALLDAQARWNVLAPTRLALLDRRVAAVLAAFPEVYAVIVDRLAEQALRLAVTQAIAHLNRVDRRVLALFWHLADRWGRVTRDGVAVPLTLSHRLIGDMIGARRPTVSTALAQLARDRQIIRREDGTWLLIGEPDTYDRASLVDLIRQRRRLIPAPNGSDEELAGATWLQRSA
jgi:CRP-like cAMP-binding protein